MGKQTFVIISLLAVLAVAALGAFLMSARGEARTLRPGLDRSQPMVDVER
jgi:hypothetical protein